ncbi:MAG: polysaccharide biosynthesis protein [Candidatus Aminicenantes bacterium]|nr:polysaccharide biosynthesis protein [Candidatus Aminicenantes bacterium]
MRIRLRVDERPPRPDLKRPLINRTLQVAIDIGVFMLSVLAAYLIRFEGVPREIYAAQLWILIVALPLVRSACFRVFRVYAKIWKYLSVYDAVIIAEAALLPTGLLFLARLGLPERMTLFKLPLSVIAMEFLFVLAGALGARLARRILWESSQKQPLGPRPAGGSIVRALLIGAGDAGDIVVKQLQRRADLGVRAVGFIDDDPAKHGLVIQGVKVLGDTNQIPQLARRLRAGEAVITISNASSRDIRRIVDICDRARLKVRIIPGLFEFLRGKVSVSKIRPVVIEDLLGRQPVDFDSHFSRVSGPYRRKRILVTGAAGSIGSELCRQLAGLEPASLILVDKDENGIFELLGELAEIAPGIRVHPLIASIRVPERMTAVFERHRPEIVFHAAAHKHVPLMESNASEAVLNNVLGTKILSRLARRFGAERMVFISSDKAVNPTSVMGATKKIGEIIIQSAAARSETRFSCVRFGNVLGSRGSVVPVFQKQIERGGPITLTHPEVKRYFMSVAEAVRLILQAGTLGRRGEVYILDMGAPIRIVDLARDLIRLSGMSEKEVGIRVIGLRPGEKLFEEILIDEERTKASQFEKIYIAPPPEVDRAALASHLSALIEAAHDGDDEAVRARLSRMGIGYKPGPRRAPTGHV